MARRVLSSASNKTTDRGASLADKATPVSFRMLLRGRPAGEGQSGTTLRNGVRAARTHLGAHVARALETRTSYSKAALQHALLAEWSAPLLQTRVRARLGRVLEVASRTAHYGGLLADANRSPTRCLALNEFPVLERQHLRQHPTAFMAPELGRCFVRSTTGTSGIVGQIVKPHESLAERAAIERRWFDSLGLGRVFQLAMVTEWSDVRPWHSLRFHDWRIRYTGMSLDDALSRLKRGERLADLVVSTPLVAQRLRDVDTSPRTTYASSFEFSSFTHARLLGYESGEFECSSETYVAGELTAPVAFRFPGCDFFHVNSDAVVVEIVDASGANVEPGLAGRIIVTDLLNDAMPLVRYDIGDFGAVVDRECCGCGRVTPRLNLLGREFHPRYDEGRWLLETLRARCDRFVLVEAARGNFVILSTDDQRELLRDASRRNLEVRATSQVPRALDGLARARSALSLAERPLPPSEASRT